MEQGVEFSRHAVEKLHERTSKQLGITRDRVTAVLGRPDYVDTSDFPILMAVGPLSSRLSLCVVYRYVEDTVRIITFFPAQRRRYEGKILSRG